jgi:hypothetical protein
VDARSRATLFGLATLVATAAACRTPDPAGPDAAPKLDAAADAAIAGKDAFCASTFGNVLTNAHGRVDGTLVAIVEPGNLRCVAPNNDHVIVQVRFNGAVYRMVVNVLSSSADHDIRFRMLPHALVGPAFAEGWHPGVALDYVTDFGVHTSDTQWAALPLLAATARISDALTIGAPISVYATSSGGINSSSTHLVHRQGAGVDGAIVVDPAGVNPQFMLFHFPTQTF